MDELPEAVVVCHADLPEEPVFRFAMLFQYLCYAQPDHIGHLRFYRIAAMRISRNYLMAWIYYTYPLGRFMSKWDDYFIYRYALSDGCLEVKALD